MPLSSAVVALRQLVSFLNTASADQLRALPKIGAKRSKQILSLRESGHVTLKDLISVRGLSSKMLGTLSGDDHVTDVIDIFHYFSTSYETVEYPNSVVSIDLGINEVAVAHLSKEINLLEWERVHLVSPRPYTPKACYEQVSDLFSRLPQAAVYLLETQSHRSGRPNVPGFMDISLKLRLLEAVIFTIIRERGLVVHSVSPKKVGRYFNLESGHYYRKKQAAVVMVSHLLGVSGIERTTTPLGNTLKLTEELREFYWHQKKLDDLSDCLLQGIAFMEWTQLHQLCEH